MGAETTSRSIKRSRPLFISGAAILAIILASLLANQLVAQRVRGDAALVTHTFEVLDSLNQVLALVRDAETGQRGYLIAGDETYLQPYTSALTSLDTEVDRLGDLTADDPAQQARVDVVRQRVEAKIAELRETIDLHQSRGFEAARALVVSGTGKAEMDALRSVVGEMRESERTLLAERSRAAERSYQRVTLGQWIAAGASIAGLALFSLIVRNQFRELREMHRISSATATALLESEERLRMAQKVSRVGTFEFNLLTGVNTWTAELEAMHGLREGSFAGTKAAWESLIHPDDRAHVLVNVSNAVESSGEFADEWRVVWADGSIRWLAGRARIIRGQDGNPERLLGINIDITDSKNREHELRRLADALELSDRRKDEFLATLAHELRNPLAPLRNSLQVMKLSAGNAAITEQSRAVMERQLVQMVRLVDDLLDVSRISSGKLHLDSTRLSLFDVLHHAVETSRPLIDAKGHQLQIDLPAEPAFVNGDATRLEQVFANLLNNAAKYSENGSRITLTVGQENGEAVVRIRDTGTGIPADMLGKIFDLFTQVDRSIDREYGGLGIGLTLVKRLVEMHGGRVTAASEGPGRGSEFTVRLPLASSIARGAHAAPDAAHGTYPSSSLSILIADDNVDSATSLAMILELMGHRVITAQDGREAVALANAHRPDAVLLDIGMPILNGYAAGSAIRAIDSHWRPMLIALTGWGQADDRRKSAEAGFDHHLVKPVDPADLQRLLTAGAAGHADTVH